MRLASRHTLPAVLTAVALLWACGDSNGPVLELAQNGGFETGDLTGWMVEDSGSGGFTATSDTSGFISTLVIPLPPESAFAAVTIQDGPGSHILYQDIALPAGKRIEFTATVYVVNGHSSWVNAPTGGLSYTFEANQQFRVDIMNPAAAPGDVATGVLLNVHQSEPGDTLTSGYVHLSADLTAFAGTSVRIRFAEVDNQFFLHAAVDAVSVTAR